MLNAHIETAFIADVQSLFRLVHNRTLKSRQRQDRAKAKDGTMCQAIIAPRYITWALNRLL